MSAWTMRSVEGPDVDSLDVGDWLQVLHGRTAAGRPNYRWARVEFATPTVEDLTEGVPHMDVAVIYEGESKRTHYRIPTGWQNRWFAWAGRHRAICEHCRGPWPCDAVEMQREMRKDSTAHLGRCGACGESGGNMSSTRRETPDGAVTVMFHTAKSRKKCRAAFIAAADETALAWLRRDEAIYAEYRARRKASR